MGVATYVDAAVIGLPTVLALLGLRMGFAPFLVWGPVRWLATLLGAVIAALLGVLYVVVNSPWLTPLSLAGAAGKSLAAIIAFLVALLMLKMFMSTLRDRVAVWTGERRPGPVARLFGGCLGAACGLVLVGIPYAAYGLIQPDRSADPPWLRDSPTLAHFHTASRAVESALSPYRRRAD